MKKIRYVLCACICFMVMGISVRADVIYEPNDSFYAEYAEDCVYENRVYTANGPDGVVILYKSPESAAEVTRWENGYTAYISFTFEDENGIVWGIYDNGDRKESGWMPMEYMDVVYDSIAFSEEFASAIRGEAGSLDEAYLGADVYFYSYPGAEEGYTVPVGEDYAPEYHRTFTDEEGRLWGNVGYYYGNKDKWICLDDPTSDFDALYPDGAPERNTADHVKKFDGPRMTPDSGKKQDHIMIWVAVIVAGVVLVSVILLIILKKMNQKQGQGGRI